MKELVFLGTTDGLLRFEVAGSAVSLRTHGLHGRYVAALADAGDAVLAAILAHGLCRVDPRTLTSEWVLDADILALATCPIRRSLGLAGTEPASVYRSDDAGRTWTELKALREMPDAGRWYHPSPAARPHVKGLAFHPEDPAVFYAGIEVGGAYKTWDGGRTFHAASEGLYEDVHGLVGHPVRGETLVAVTGRGVYRTDDGARSWRPATRGMTRRYTAAAGILGAPTEAVVVGAAQGPPWNASFGASAMIFRSSGGDGWDVAMEGLPSTLDGVPVGFAPSPVFPGRVYCGVASGELLASDSGGRSWRLLAGDLPSIQAILCTQP